MKLNFLGAAPCMFDPGEDAPCYLINDELLIDCGWHVTGTLRGIGYEIGKLKTVLLTHLHHDHYLGLAGLLFHIAQSECLDMAELVIAGPGEDLAKVVDLAWEFMQLDRYYAGLPHPKLLPLDPGDTLETETLTVKTGYSRHPVEARSYRVTEKASGFALGFSGDTVRHEESVPFFRGCGALIHDAACGYSCSQPIAERRYGHSSLCEAAEIAGEAGIPLLYPVHLSREAASAAVERYRREFPDSGITVKAAHLGDEVMF